MEFKITLSYKSTIVLGQECLYWHMIIYTKVFFFLFPITLLFCLSFIRLRTINNMALPKLNFENILVMRGHNWISTDHLYRLYLGNFYLLLIAWFHNG